MNQSMDEVSTRLEHRPSKQRVETGAPEFAGRVRVDQTNLPTGLNRHHASIVCESGSSKLVSARLVDETLTSWVCQRFGHTAASEVL